MPVLHKDLSRLSRDAKKLRKEINLFTDKKISAQKSLDLVATFFQWDSWNEMYVAWESKSKTSDMWHDFRRRDKLDVIITGESLLSIAIEESDIEIKKEDLNHLVEWFSSKYHPSNFAIKSQKKGLFSWKSSTNYLDLPKLRFREGVEMLASDTQKICDHLDKQFIETLNRPGCIVNCRQMDAIDFIRVFKKHDYKVKIISEDILLPLYIDAENIPMKLSLDAKSQFSVDAFLKHHLSRVNKESQYRHNATELLVDFVISLRANNPENRYSPYLPGLKELLDISDNHKSELVRDKANKFIALLCSDGEVASKAKRGIIPTFLIEQYQYISMQISEVINKSYSSSVNPQFDGAHLGSVERPNQGELLVVFIPGRSSTNISLMSMITTSIMNKLSDKMIAESEDDIWFFNPNNGPEKDIINGEKCVFDFKRFNSAKANLVLYGQDESYSFQADTLVRINDNCWNITNSQR